MSQGGSRPARQGSDAALADAVRELSHRIEALQADVRRLAQPRLPGDGAAPDDGASDAERFAWIAAVGPPVRRPPRVPRLALESLFLVATALGAGLARLDALVVVAVMSAAWALVALLELTALRVSRSRPTFDADAVAPPRDAVAADPAWLVPPVQHTVLEPPPESPTTIAPLPPRPGGQDVAAERVPST